MLSRHCPTSLPQRFATSSSARRSTCIRSSRTSWSSRRLPQRGNAYNSSSLRRNSATGSLHNSYGGCSSSWVTLLAPNRTTLSYGNYFSAAPQPCSHGAGLLWGHCFPRHPGRHGRQDVGSCSTHNVVPCLSSYVPNPNPASPCQLGSGPAPVKDQWVTPTHLLAAALHRSP